MENWTGILGSAVLVAGITFIGGYTGLRLSPFYRTLMIVAAAALLAGGGILLDRRAQWKLLAQWLKSSGAAVFLFACFGASAVPGLSWIRDLTMALAVLLVGVAVNLIVAFRARSEPFASLHVVLSLVPLALIPQSDLTLVLATLVAAAGVSLSFRERWDVHTLVTLGCFIVFQAAWYTRVFEPAPTIEGRLLGILTTLVIGTLAALTHYRASYSGERLKSLPWITHLASWSLLGAGLALYHVGNTPFRGVALIVAGVTVFLLARKGRALGTRWLYLTDTLVGQALVTVGVISFYPFVSNWLLIPALVLLQCGLYLRVVLDEPEEFLIKVGAYLVHLAALALAVCGMIAYQAESNKPTQAAAILLGGGVLAAVIHLFLANRRGERFDSVELYGGASSPHPASLLGVLAGLISVVGLANLEGLPSMIPVAFGAATILVLLSRVGPSAGLAVATVLVLLLAHLWSWFTVFDQHPLPVLEQLRWHLGPLLLADTAAIGLVLGDGAARLLRQTAIYLGGLTIAAAAYTLLQPISSLAPSVAWLVLSLVALELAGRVRRPYAGAVLHLGYLALLFFGAGYTLVVLQAQAYLGPVPVRLLIEVFALGVGAYWWVYRPSESLAGVRSWRVVHPLFLELALAFLAVVVAVEMPAQWRPLAWAALALICIAGPLDVSLDPRFRFYSLVFFWASIGDLVAVTSTLAVPTRDWYQHPGFSGGLTILLQIGYLALGSPRLHLAELNFPPGLGGLSRLAARIGHRQAVWLYYPFFIGVALFLYWRFSSAVLTLLWVTEAFVVFALSLVLRESHFRYMALAGLGACMIRLIVFDMAESNLGMRGLVFVGVGALMLGMHSLYNRYKSRFA